MLLQKRLEYGFNGYQGPPTARAARSATRRVPFWKKIEDNNNNSNCNNNSNINNNSNCNNGNNNKPMCAFDLLTTVARKLLQEGGDKINGEETEIVKHSIIKTAEQAVEDDPSNVNICDQGSCNRSFFVSEIISQAPVIDEFKDTYSGPSSGITVSDSSEKVKVKVNDPFSCKVEDNKNSKPIRKEALKPLVVHNIDNNVNLVVRDDDDDDDENSFGVTQDPNKTFKPPSCIGDRRIRRFLASKYKKSSPKLNDAVNSDADVYRNRKPCYKRPRSLKDYPFKKKRLYELEHYSNSDDVVNCEVRSSQPPKDSIENGSRSGMKTSGFLSKQNPVFHTRDSHFN